jgi:hypothetical protein
MMRYSETELYQLMIQKKRTVFNRVVPCSFYLTKEVSGSKGASLFQDKGPGPAGVFVRVAQGQRRKGCPGGSSCGVFIRKELVLKLKLKKLVGGAGERDRIFLR